MARTVTEIWVNDPGNERYYADCKAARQQAEAALSPAQIKIGYAGFLVGGWTLIWYWGKNETNFATGLTVEAAIRDVERQVFRGL